MVGNSVYFGDEVELGFTEGALFEFMLFASDPDETKRFFRLGLIAFLLGHVFYVIAFIQAAGDFDAYQWWSIFAMLLLTPTMLPPLGPIMLLIAQIQQGMQPLIHL